MLRINRMCYPFLETYIISATELKVLRSFAVAASYFKLEKGKFHKPGNENSWERRSVIQRNAKN